jgi:hypothetical protein
MQLSSKINPEDELFSFLRGIMQISSESGLKVSKWWTTAHEMDSFSGLKKQKSMHTRMKVSIHELQNSMLLYFLISWQ